MQNRESRSQPVAKEQADSHTIKVVVVDDHPAVREALADTIEGEATLQFRGAAGTAREALRVIQEVRPDVVVVDICLEEEDGLDLVSELLEWQPELGIVVFSMHDENLYAERAIRAGAMAYVMKSKTTQSVSEAIRTVAQGEFYLSPHMASRLRDELC